MLKKFPECNRKEHRFYNDKYFFIILRNVLLFRSQILWTALFNFKWFFLRMVQVRQLFYFIDVRKRLFSIYFNKIFLFIIISNNFYPTAITTCRNVIMLNYLSVCFCFPLCPNLLLEVV